MRPTLRSSDRKRPALECACPRCPLSHFGLASACGTPWRDNGLIVNICDCDNYAAAEKGTAAARTVDSTDLAREGANN